MPTTSTSASCGPAPEHAEELAQLHAGCFDEPWDARGLSGSARVTQARRLSWRASAAPAEMVGFILGQLAADEAEILTLGVRADRQRHGIGRKLVEALARAAKKAEARRLHLEVGGRQCAGARALQEARLQESAGARATMSTPGDARRRCGESGPCALSAARAALRCRGGSPISAQQKPSTPFREHHVRLAGIRLPLASSGSAPTSGCA